MPTYAECMATIKQKATSEKKTDGALRAFQLKKG